MNTREKVKEALDSLYDELINSPGSKASKESLSFVVKGYWCGSILRFDINPKGDTSKWI